ncbi:hypothetical protein GYMLUDRAFT_59187 [Collybiopsis luxurians FD-317 M1]|uniref:Uncharacterized protein n=1 Tax=Collybiopsis luxurians FD-317 M1 TaxID=944289 RepID=A0A0D0BC31_9AGAR|nr:hypothetical protein GYMLUDRAFT_59187 [Collybiopsis luxurians FD-317 M1]
MYSAAPSAPSYGETSTLAPRFSSQNSPHLLHNNYNSFGSAREDAAGMLQLHQNTPPVSPSGHRPSFVEFSPSMLYVQNQDANAPNSDSRSSSNGERLEFDPSRLVAMKTAQSNAVRDDQLRNTEVRLHADSGVRFTPSNRREVIDVPPTYTDA